MSWSALEEMWACVQKGCLCRQRESERESGGGRRNRRSRRSSSGLWHDVHVRSAATNAGGRRQRRRCRRRRCSARARALRPLALRAICRVVEGMLLVIAAAQGPSLPPAVGLGHAGSQLRARVAHLRQSAPPPLPLALLLEALLLRALACCCLARLLALLAGRRRRASGRGRHVCARAAAAAAAHAQALLFHGRHARHVCTAGRQGGHAARVGSATAAKLSRQAPSEQRPTRRPRDAGRDAAGTRCRLTFQRRIP